MYVVYTPRNQLLASGVVQQSSTWSTGVSTGPVQLLGTNSPVPRSGTLQVHSSSEPGSGSQEQQQQQGQCTNIDHQLPLKTAAVKAELLASLASQEKFKKIRLALQEDFKDLREHVEDPDVDYRDLEIAAREAELLANLAKRDSILGKDLEQDSMKDLQELRETIKEMEQNIQGGIRDMTLAVGEDIRDMGFALKRDLQDLREDIENLRKELKRGFTIINFMLALVAMLLVATTPDFLERVQGWWK